MSLDGLVVPTPTLFGADGAPDPGRNARFSRALSEARAEHLFVLGSLGEFPSVLDDERPALLESVIESVSGPTDVWVGCGAPSTRQAVARAVEAEGAGAAALVVVPPYYLHPPLSSVERYYREVAAAVKIPVLAYNIPSLVGYALPPELVHRWANERVLAGAKDTSGSLPSVAAFLRDRPAGFAVFPGDDRLATDSIIAGAAGAVMGMANIVPKLCGELVAAARAGDLTRARERQALVDALSAVVATGPFPSTVKFLAAELRGADVGYRAPYDPLTTEEISAVRARLDTLLPALRPFLGR